LLDLGFEQKLQAIIKALDQRKAAAADNSYSADPSSSSSSRPQTVLLSATLHPRLTSLTGLSMKDPVGIGFTAKLVDGQLQVLEAGGQQPSNGKSSKATTKNDAMAEQQAAAAIAAKFDLPQQLQQKYMEVPAKMRLVALIGGHAGLSRLKQNSLQW
jgi:hypothetical protein